MTRLPAEQNTVYEIRLYFAFHSGRPTGVNNNLNDGGIPFR